MAILHGNEVAQSLNPTTQVYKATHVGTDKMSLRDRSFISFSYGGKDIEDFNLIAIIDGDRMSRATYGEFEDLTTSYEIVDGQFYWGTHFLNNTLDLTLATDEITENELEDFKQWFKPGQIKELILAEHPNRGAWARVSTTPTYEMLPFEKKVTRKVAGIERETSTTVYRGTIELSFIMDEPFWHSLYNIIEPYYYDKDHKFTSMLTEQRDGAIETVSDRDFLKVIFEDGVPHRSMIKSNLYMFGNEQQWGTETLSDQVSAYCYYCGNAPGRPRIEFTITPTFDNLSYISYPLNTYSKIANPNLGTYNTISVGSSTMRFTLPSLYLGYNQAINVVRSMYAGEAADDFRTAIQEGVTEYYARSWALLVLEVMLKNAPLWGISDERLLVEGSGLNNFRTTFITAMKYFITGYTADGTQETYSVTISIDSKTGEATGRFEIRASELEQAMPSQLSDFGNYTRYFLEESVADMIKSNYLVINERNSPNENGEIGGADCTEIKTDYPATQGGLTRIRLYFQNMYF